MWSERFPFTSRAPADENPLMVKQLKEADSHCENTNCHLWIFWVEETLWLCLCQKKSFPSYCAFILISQTCYWFKPADPNFCCTGYIYIKIQTSEEQEVLQSLWFYLFLLRLACRFDQTKNEHFLLMYNLNLSFEWMLKFVNETEFGTVKKKSEKSKIS